MRSNVVFCCFWFILWSFLMIFRRNSSILTQFCIFSIEKHRKSLNFKQRRSKEGAQKGLWGKIVEEGIKIKKIWKEVCKEGAQKWTLWENRRMMRNDHKMIQKYKKNILSTIFDFDPLFHDFPPTYPFQLPLCSIFACNGVIFRAFRSKKMETWVKSGEFHRKFMRNDHIMNEKYQKTILERVLYTFKKIQFFGFDPFFHGFPPMSPFEIPLCSIVAWKGVIFHVFQSKKMGNWVETAEFHRQITSIYHKMVQQYQKTILERTLSNFNNFQFFIFAPCFSDFWHFLGGKKA